jgi:hypothetical protein
MAFQEQTGMNGLDLLTTLKTADAPLTTLELAIEQETSKSTIANKIRPLVQSGMVTRLVDHDDHRRRVYRYMLPDADNPLQVRHLRTGGYSLRCPGCGKRRRLKHYRDAYLLECECGQHQRFTTDDKGGLK